MTLKWYPQTGNRCERLRDDSRLIGHFWWGVEFTSLCWASSGARLPGLLSQLYHLAAAWPGHAPATLYACVFLRIQQGYNNSTYLTVLLYNKWVNTYELKKVHDWGGGRKVSLCWLEETAPLWGASPGNKNSQQGYEKKGGVCLKLGNGSHFAFCRRWSLGLPGWPCARVLMNKPLLPHLNCLLTCPLSPPPFYMGFRVQVCRSGGSRSDSIFPKVHLLTGAVRDRDPTGLRGTCAVQGFLDTSDGNLDNIRLTKKVSAKVNNLWQGWVEQAPETTAMHSFFMSRLLPVRGCHSLALVLIPEAMATRTSGFKVRSHLTVFYISVFTALWGCLRYCSQTWRYIHAWGWVFHFKR